MEIPKKQLLKNAGIARKLINIPLPEEKPEPRGKVRVAVIRVNPFTKGIAKLELEMSTDPQAGAAVVARSVRANAIGSQSLEMEVDGHPLYAAGAVNLSSATLGWKLRDQGLETDTSGIGLIFTRSDHGGMASVPISMTADWARENIIWTEGTPEDALEGSGDGSIA